MEKINYKQILTHLNLEGVLAYPTETLWGLGGLAASAKAADLVYSVKGRSKEMPLSLLVRNSEMASRYCKVSEEAKKILEVYWPGPVTFVLPKLNNDFDYLTNGSDFIGLRCSSHKFCKELFLNLDEALITTSANKSTEANPKVFSELSWLPEEILKVSDEQFQEEEIFFEGSTIVKIDDSKMEILRKGPVEVSTKRN